MRVLRSLAFDFLWACWTALFGLTIPVLWLLGSPPESIRRISRVWARGMLALLATTTGLRHVVRGGDHLTAEPCLIIANHQSTWETVAALVLFPNVAIVTKRELLRIPVMGWFLKHSPMIIIDRSEAARALREMAAASSSALAEGRSVLIFPEGTRTAVGAPVKFRRGVELLYRALGVPVIPVATNSGRHWRLDSKAKLAGTIIVSILPPIAPGLGGVEFARKAEAVLQAEKSALGG
jgi:1-acyl-sn-glycerol-3-phosphate acyltransferase